MRRCRHVGRSVHVLTTPFIVDEALVCCEDGEKRRNPVGSVADKFYISLSLSVSLCLTHSLSPPLSLSVSLKQTHAHTLTHTHVLFSVSLTLTLTNAFSNRATLARMHTHSFYVSLPFLSRYSLIIKNWSFYLVHFVLLIIHFFFLLLRCPFGIFAPNSISLIPIFGHMVALLRVLFFLRIEATRSVVVLCLERMHQLHFLAVKCACK